MPRKRLPRRKVQSYWWNEDIAKKRKTCNEKRRKAQRLKIKDDAGAETAWNEYKEARRSYVEAIRTSKEKCWADLCEEIDKDPWGKPYKIIKDIVGKGREPTKIPTPEEAKEILGQLSPEAKVRQKASDTSQREPTRIESFTV